MEAGDAGTTYADHGLRWNKPGENAFPRRAQLVELGPSGSELSTPGSSAVATTAP